MRDECLKALGAAKVPPVQMLAQYMELVLDWNEKVNITGARNPTELAEKHIADVWLASQLYEHPPEEIFDIGSGGGIPGIPLAIIWPSTKVTLVERRQKKASVLSSMVSKLGLDGRVTVQAKAFEEVKPRPDSAEYWFRGVLPGPKLAAYFSKSFPRADIGKVVLMKGPNWPNEKLDILNTTGVKEAWLERFGSAMEFGYELPSGVGQRMLVLV